MMKRANQAILAILVSVIVLFSMIILPAEDVSAVDPYFPGSGTSTSPFLISTASQLAQLATLVNAGNANYNSKYYQLSNDISLSGIDNWTPIGKWYYNSFNGTFDGNSHRVLYMNITCAANNADTGDQLGLFGLCRGTIKNLTVTGFSINVAGTSYAYAAGIAGFLQNGSIKDCYASGSLKSTTYGAYGGIVGHTDHGDITDCINKAYLACEGSVGGIAGGNSGAAIARCYNSGEMYCVESSTCGGISGTNANGAFISNSYNIGKIYGANSVGGINGQNNATITKCYNAGAISGRSLPYASGYNIGGISGMNFGAIGTCYYLNNVSAACVNSPDGATCIAYAKTITQMQTKSTYVGFDFTSIWAMPVGLTSTPLLQALYVPLTDIVLEDTTMLKGQTKRILQPVPYNATYTECTWQVNDPTIVSVTSTGVVTAKAVGSTFVLATSKQGSITKWCTVTVQQGVESITIPAAKQLETGASVSLTASVSPTTANNKNLTWTSSNTAVATVDSSGNVKGLLPGTATIKAKAQDGSGIYDTCIVTVIRRVSGITLADSPSSLFAGETMLLEAVVAPEDASDQTVAWTSSNPAVAEVNSIGEVTGISRGLVTITAKTVDGGFTAVRDLEIIQPVNKIVLNENTLGMDLNAQFQLTAVPLPANANDQGLTWRSTDETVATVTADGLVTALKDGVAVIIIQSADKYTMVYCVVVVGNTPYTDLINTMVANQTAKSVSYNSVAVTWSPVALASGYSVYKSTSLNGSYTLAGNVSGTSTSCTVSGLTTGAAQYFKVRGYSIYNGYKVYSEYSNAASAKPVPAVPANFAAYSSGFTSNSLIWNAVAGASGYVVYRLNAATGTYDYLKLTTATSTTDASLTMNKTYYYKIRAYRTVGTTKVYGSFTAVRSSKPIGAVPSNFAVASVGYSSLKLSWSAISGASGYKIYRATSAAGAYALIATTASTSYTNTGLTTGKTYYYKIRAYRQVGTSNVYASYTAVRSAVPIPATPANFTASRYSSTSIKTSWTSVSGASGYQIYRATSATGTYSLLKTTSLTYYTNTGLTTGKTYYYKVRAYRVVGTAKVYGGFTTVKYAKP